MATQRKPWFVRYDPSQIQQGRDIPSRSASPYEAAGLNDYYRDSAPATSPTPPRFSPTVEAPLPARELRVPKAGSAADSVENQPHPRYMPSEARPPQSMSIEGISPAPDDTPAPPEYEIGFSDRPAIREDVGAGVTDRQPGKGGVSSWEPTEYGLDHVDWAGQGRAAQENIDNIADRQRRSLKGRIDKAKREYERFINRGRANAQAYGMRPTGNFITQDTTGQQMSTRDIEDANYLNKLRGLSRRMDFEKSSGKKRAVQKQIDALIDNKRQKDAERVNRFNKTMDAFNNRIEKQIAIDKDVGDRAAGMVAEWAKLQESALGEIPSQKEMHDAYKGFVRMMRNEEEPTAEFLELILSIGENPITGEPLTPEQAAGIREEIKALK